MDCRVQDLRKKEVVCIKDGAMLGCVSDIAFDTSTAHIESIVIYGKPRFFGLLGKEDDCIIPWTSIEIIGEDTILIDSDTFSPRHRRRRGLIDRIKSREII